MIYIVKWTYTFLFDKINDALCGIKCYFNLIPGLKALKAIESTQNCFVLVLFRDDASLGTGDGLDDNEKEPKKKLK